MSSFVVDGRKRVRSCATDICDPTRGVDGEALHHNIFIAGVPCVVRADCEGPTALPVMTL